MEQPSNFTKAKPTSSSNNGKPPKAKKISISILGMSLPLLYVSLLHIPPSALFNDTTFWFLMSNSIIIIVAADSGFFCSSLNETSDLQDEFIKHSRARGACLVAEPPPETSIKERPKEIALAQSQMDVAADKNMVAEENSASEEKPVDKDVAVKEKSLPQSEEYVDKSIVEYEKPPRHSVMQKKDDHRMEEAEPSKLPLQRSVTEKRKDHRMVGGGRSNLAFRRSATERRSHPNLEQNEYSKLSNEELNERVEEFIRRFNREIRLQLSNE